MLYYLKQTNIKKYNGIADPRTIIADSAVDPHNVATLVNKGFALSKNFKPKNLTNVSGFSLRTDAGKAWKQMESTCLQETGIDLVLKSGYRSYSVQKILFENAIKRKGIKLTVGYNALAGRSEHQLGLAIDVVDKNTTRLVTSFAKTPAYSWLSSNAHRFGYILRYPAHKVHITDYSFEPWHFRFVGKELATHLYKNDLTLEEYYGLGPIA